MTVDDLFTKCLSEYWNCERFIKSGHFKETQSKYNLHIKPAFGHLDYLSVTRGMVRDWHATFRSIPTTGNRAKEILSRLYSFALEKELNENSYNPCKAVKKFTERSRRRFANDSELKKIGEILDRLYAEMPLEVTFIWTLMFTGSRPRAIERASWDELTEDNGVGVLVFDGKSTEKTGDPECVIFPTKIMDLIKKLPRRKDRLIFGIPLPSYLWRKIRTEAGCEDLWCRDLRRGFATAGITAGVTLDRVGLMLNHRADGTTKKYAKLTNRPRIETSEKIVAKLDSILKKA